MFPSMQLRHLVSQFRMTGFGGLTKVFAQDDIVAKPFRAHELTPKITSLLLNPPSGDTPHSPMSLASPGSEMSGML